MVEDTDTAGAVGEALGRLVGHQSRGASVGCVSARNRVRGSASRVGAVEEVIPGTSVATGPSSSMPWNHQAFHDDVCPAHRSTTRAMGLLCQYCPPPPWHEVLLPGELAGMCSEGSKATLTPCCGCPMRVASWHSRLRPRVWLWSSDQSLSLGIHTHSPAALEAWVSLGGR